MSRQDLRRKHTAQRYAIALVVVGFLTAMWLAITFSWIWVPTGLAQPTAQTLAATPTVTSQDDLTGRFEELSRSQDRFVQTILGITALIGTGFLVLIGVNAFQSNRNFERESAYMRDHVELQTQKAVTEVQEQLRLLLDEAVAEADESVKKSLSFGLSRLIDERKTAKAEIDQGTANAKKLLQDHLYSFSSFVTWSANKESQALKAAQASADVANSAEVHEVRLHAASLYGMAVVIFDLFKLSDDGRLEGLRSAALSYLGRALEAMMTGITIPEENEWWYSDSGHHFGRVQEITNHYKLIDRYRTAAEDLRALMPTNGQKLSRAELKRLVERKTPSLP